MPSSTSTTTLADPGHIPIPISTLLEMKTQYAHLDYLYQLACIATTSGLVWAMGRIRIDWSPEDLSQTLTDLEAVYEGWIAEIEQEELGPWSAEMGHKLAKSLHGLRSSTPTLVAEHRLLSTMTSLLGYRDLANFIASVRDALVDVYWARYEEVAHRDIDPRLRAVIGDRPCPIRIRFDRVTPPEPPWAQTWYEDDHSPQYPHVELVDEVLTRIGEPPEGPNQLKRWARRVQALMSDLGFTPTFEAPVAEAATTTVASL